MTSSGCHGDRWVLDNDSNLSDGPRQAGVEKLAQGRQLDTSGIPEIGNTSEALVMVICEWKGFDFLMFISIYNRPTHLTYTAKPALRIV